jgi:uncharacterized protein (TIGR03083 family)
MFIKSDETVVWEHVKSSRVQLIAFFDTLSDEQWCQYSLCNGWQARDVLAHLILEYHYKFINSWKDFIRTGFSLNRFLKYTAKDLGKRPTKELLEYFRLMIDEQHKPSSVPVMNVLVDLLVHEQDIRIPLDQKQDIDMESLRLIFTHWEPKEYNLGERITGIATRISGLKFIMTDLNITKGEGLEIIGKAQDVLLTVVGRTVALDKLNGNGLAVLKNRLR